MNKKEESMMKSVYLIVPHTAEVEDWLTENVLFEAYQKFDGSIVVEHRYLDGIQDGLQEDGFLLGEDYDVR